MPFDLIPGAADAIYDTSDTLIIGGRKKGVKEPPFPPLLLSVIR